MALTMKSSMVTAPTKSSLNSYIIKVPSTVNDDTINVDKKAVTYHNEMVKAYKEIKKNFDQISAELNNAVKNVGGNVSKSRMKRIANKCAKQGQACIARQQEMSNTFEYAQLEQKINSLEEALAKLQ